VPGKILHAKILKIFSQIVECFFFLALGSFFLPTIVLDYIFSVCIGMLKLRKRSVFATVVTAALSLYLTDLKIACCIFLLCKIYLCMMQLQTHTQGILTGAGKIFYPDTPVEIYPLNPTHCLCWAIFIIKCIITVLLKRTGSDCLHSKEASFSSIFFKAEKIRPLLDVCHLIRFTLTRL
jgi:hypothetical protein